MKVIVVGAGIAGLSSAWALTKRGHRVTLLEQGPVPNPLAASGDHHRIIRRAYGRGNGYGRMITEAYEAWDEMWGDLGTTHYDHRGFMCISREPGDEAEDYRDGLREGGWPFEVFDPAEAAARWPFLEPGTFRYAILSPEGGALHCRRIASDLAAWLRANGAEIRDGVRVTAVNAERGEVLLAEGEPLHADRVVVTAGAWVTKLFPDLAGRLSTYRTALAYLEPPADLKAAWDAAPVILDVGGDTDGYIIPPTGGGGLKFGTGRHKVPSADADMDRAPWPDEGRAILRHFAPPMARLDDYRVASVVTCAYTFTADERFTSLARGRCLVVSSCSGHGYKFGAAVGRRVAMAVETGAHDSLLAWLEARAA
ncbi:NAD(P)/FAD-dependent oxidoreductase [Rubellimicrobium arenae]|uniref:NAD(P)/FAD-dependent oxidoreductase n=1 Tax=Rubellimicrobium arenae TaxID=2817372 RepID=UPI001B307533